MKQSLALVFLLTLTSLYIGCSLRSEPAEDILLPAVFSDNMVLQRDMTIPVWGTASSGGKVTVQLFNQEKSTRANSKGEWRLELKPIAAGGPYEMKIIGKDTLAFRNVMIGEVWLCSGQSNMEMPLAGWGKVLNYEQEIASANYPNIRLLQVEHVMRNQPWKIVRSDGWKECSPATIAEFSATAYFFGRNLYKNINVPIGLIHSSWGGTVVEAWTSAETLTKHPDFADVVTDLQNGKYAEEDFWNVYKKKLDDWKNLVRQMIKNLGGYKHGWEKVGFSDSAWPTMNLPTLWEKAGLDVDGIVWFRKEIELPSSWQGRELTLYLGPINDFDVTWFNGVEVGSEANFQIPRIYKIPGKLVRAGKNVIAVQVLDIGNKGGLYGEPEELKLVKDKTETVSLTGAWKYKVDPLPIDLQNLQRPPGIPNSANRPTVLYNGMIAPLIPYAIRGAIWYQGEANAGRAYQYRSLFKMLIQDWRMHWRQGDFPFLFVQLASFMQPKPQPSDDAWAELREAQLMALSLPNTGMAVAIDIGDARDIHPKNKQEVGRRLALIARATVYGENIEYSGPLYQSMIVKNNKIRLRFSHTDGGLVFKAADASETRKGEGFAIAGADKKFRWAKAKIDGDEIVVWHPAVSKPVAVRYAWAANPVCNLYNKAGLPASPFRTDSWPGITEGKK